MGIAVGDIIMRLNSKKQEGLAVGSIIKKEQTGGAG